MGKESAYTSLKQIPAVFKKYELGERNFDFGGGKYDNGSRYLFKHQTINMVYDPFNRTSEHNNRVLTYMLMGNISSITCLNVLNVIKDKEERKVVLSYIRYVLDQQSFGKLPVIFFQFYEGNRSGIPSKKTTQTNMKTVDYIPEIQVVFPEFDIQREGNVLIV